MKIHLLSDIHLESGPYELPPDLECDVIVAAGDIGVGTQGVEWLKTLDKPVVYVAGNHEYWSEQKNPIDMFQVQRDIRNAAEGSNVHYLENETVTIDGVQFIGATLWTNLGSCGYDLLPGLIREARFMGDSCIYCKEFYDNESLNSRFFYLIERYIKDLREEADLKDWIRENAIKRSNKGEWHPLVSLILHNISLSFITNHTKFDPENPDQKRVVVTHHHPSYRSLLKAKVLSEEQLSPRSRLDYVSGREHSGFLQAAAYASDLELLQPCMVGSSKLDRFSNQISHWLCGHLHRSLDYYQAGVRVTCNPRGHFAGKSKKAFLENPYAGDCISFQRNLLVEVEHRSHKTI